MKKTKRQRVVEELSAILFRNSQDCDTMWEVLDKRSVQAIEGAIEFLKTERESQKGNAKITDTDRLDFLIRYQRIRGSRFSIRYYPDQDVFYTKRKKDVDIFTRKHKTLRDAIDCLLEIERKQK